MKNLITSLGFIFACSLLNLSAHAEVTRAPSAKTVELPQVVVVGKRLSSPTPAVKNITLPRVVITAKSNTVKPTTPGMVQVKAVGTVQDKS